MVINLLAIKIECDERDCLQFCCVTSKLMLTFLEVEKAGGKILGSLEGQSSPCNLVCFGSVDLELSFYVFQDLELFCIVFFCFFF